MDDDNQTMKTTNTSFMTHNINNDNVENNLNIIFEKKLKNINDIKKNEIELFPKLNQNINNNINFTLNDNFFSPTPINKNDPDYDPDSYEECFTLRYNHNSTQIACGFSSGRVSIFQLNDNNSNNNKVKKNPLNKISSFPITCLRWKPKKPTILLCVSADGFIYELHSSSLKPLQILEEPNNPLMCVDYNNDGSLFATGGNDKFLRLYDDETKTLISKLISKKYTLPEHSNRIFCCKFSPNDNNLLISGGWDNTLLLYDVRTKEVTNFLYGPHLAGDGIDIKDNLMLTVSWDKKDQISLWDLRMNKIIKIFQVNDIKKEYYNEIVEEVRNDIIITSEEINKNVNNETYLYSCKFNPINKSFIVTGSNRNVMRVYDYNEGNIHVLCKNDFLETPCYCCDWNNDGKSFCFGCADSMVRLVEKKK
jgi:WD40 repeat protein